MQKYIEEYNEDEEEFIYTILECSNQFPMMKIVVWIITFLDCETLVLTDVLN